MEMWQNYEHEHLWCVKMFQYLLIVFKIQTMKVKKFIVDVT